ncbi:MAG: hypothetical protein IKR73_08195 [Oscillospiraceae bacterium]|nr:hypothetical protein [Oscillospiraceae bacterium]
MKKRRLSAVLAAVMCLSVMTPAYADEIGEEPDDSAPVIEDAAVVEEAATNDPADDAAADEAVDALDDAPDVTTPTAAASAATAPDMTLDEAIARVREMEAETDPQPFKGREISDEDMECLRRVVNYQNTGTDMYAEDGELYTDAFEAYAGTTHIKPEGSSDFYYDQMSDRFKQAHDMCVAKLEEFATSNRTLDNTYCIAVIDLPGTGWTKGRALGIGNEVLISNPQYWFQDVGFRWSVNDEDTTARLAFYALDVAKTPSARKTINNKIKNKTMAWLGAVEDLPNDRLKTEKLAELMGKDIIYDPVVADTGESEKPYPYTMYGVYCTDTAVCEGYALAMQYVCTLAGIDCIHMLSLSGDHSWNRVKLDGEWYEFDATWYDQDVDEGGSDPQMWLNVSTEYMLSNDSQSAHIPDHHLYEIPFDGKPIVLPECAAHTSPRTPDVEVTYEDGKAILSCSDVGSDNNTGSAEGYYWWLYEEVEEEPEEEVEEVVIEEVDKFERDNEDLEEEIIEEEIKKSGFVCKNWVEGTEIALTAEDLGGEKGDVVVYYGNENYRATDKDILHIDLGHVHTYDEKGEWVWELDDNGRPESAGVTVQCTDCGHTVYGNATLTDEGAYILATAEIEGKTYTDKWSFAPAKPTTVIKTAFGGRTVTLNCTDTDAEIYYQFGSSNITTDCAHVKAGQTIFLDEPMTGTKAAMYFKAYRNGLWSPLGKWGVLNVKIAQPLMKAKGNSNTELFFVYTQTKNSYIVYTLDGTVPAIEEGTQKLKVKNGNIIWGTQSYVTIPKGCTFKAIAIRCGLVTSEVITYQNGKATPKIPDPTKYGFTNAKTDKAFAEFKDYMYIAKATKANKTQATSALNSYINTVKKAGFTVKMTQDLTYYSERGVYYNTFTIHYNGKQVAMMMGMMAPSNSGWELCVVINEKI